MSRHGAEYWRERERVRRAKLTLRNVHGSLCALRKRLRKLPRTTLAKGLKRELANQIAKLEVQRANLKWIIGRKDEENE